MVRSGPSTPLLSKDKVPSSEPTHSKDSRGRSPKKSPRKIAAKPFPDAYKNLIRNVYDKNVDLYGDILGIEQTDNEKEIRAAYFEVGHAILQKQSDKSSLKFQALTRCYEILANPVWKAWYDQHGFEKPSILRRSKSWGPRQNNPRQKLRWKDQLEEASPTKKNAPKLPSPKKKSKNRVVLESSPTGPTDELSNSLHNSANDIEVVALNSVDKIIQKVDESYSSVEDSVVARNLFEEITKPVEANSGKRLATSNISSVFDPFDMSQDGSLSTWTSFKDANQGFSKVPDQQRRANLQKSRQCLSFDEAVNVSTDQKTGQVKFERNPVSDVTFMSNKSPGSVQSTPATYKKQDEATVLDNVLSQMTKQLQEADPLEKLHSTLTSFTTFANDVNEFLTLPEKDVGGMLQVLESELKDSSDASSSILRSLSM